jgi:Uma2 family endonuclease
MKPARKPATYDELCKVPEHMVAEIVDGELVTSPRPASPHARASSAMGSDLFGNFDGPPGGAGRPGGWWILDEPELHFGADVLVPDLAGWRRERMPVLSDVPSFTQAPDWLCEVLSPSTVRLDRTRKMAIYARVGVPHVWLVDPLVRRLEVHRLHDGRFVLAATHAGDDAVGAAPFEAVQLAIGRWWMETSA